EIAAGRGVRFMYNSISTRLFPSRQDPKYVHILPRWHKFDAFVVAQGSYSPRWLRKMGIHIPVFPVKGYSITVPVTNPDAAPVSTVMDETYKVAITRLGDRIRV